MAYLIRQTSNLTSPQLLSKAAFIVERMTGNPAFPDPTPKLDDVNNAIVALQNSMVGALDGGKTATATRHIHHRALRLLLNQLGGYVSSVAEGNELAILSSGYGVWRRGTPAPEPVSPTDLRARISDHAGRVDLGWTPVKPAVTYHIQHTNDDPAVESNWKLVGVSTRSRYSVKGLPSGATAHFRVAGIGTAGVGPWSQVASTLVR